MKKRIIALFTAALLLLSLAGCSGSEYRKAKHLYKKGEYAAAQELFQTLGDFKDAPDMVLKCRMGSADVLMQQGDYASAAQCYEQLGDYENCAALGRKARIYQLWAYILENGEPSSDGTKTVSGTYNSKGIFLNADSETPGTIYLFLHQDKHILADFTYDMILRVESGHDLAGVTAEHTMKVSMGGTVSTSNSTYQGHLNLGSFTRGQFITLTAYNQVGVDMYGKSTSSQSLEGAPVEELHENLYDLIDGTKQLIELTGTGATLQDLGFSSWE